MFHRTDPNWAADVQRVGLRYPLLKEQSLWAIWVYRFGKRTDQLPDGFAKCIKTKWYWLMFRIVETVTGISLPKGCSIGPGLRIWHFGAIFVHPNATIGRNCTLRQGVTIGNRGGDDDSAPTLGDDVDVGAFAQIIGPVRIGDKAKIGALTVVVKDVPSRATAIGSAARIIERN